MNRNLKELGEKVKGVELNSKRETKRQKRSEGHRHTERGHADASHLEPRSLASMEEMAALLLRLVRF